MSPIVIPDELLAQLRASGNSVEFVDKDGNSVGFFTPKLNPDDWENLEPELSEEELQEMLKQEGGRTLSEIMADLEKRG